MNKNRLRYRTLPSLLSTETYSLPPQSIRQTALAEKYGIVIK
jgi:hypothetical protein